MRKLGKKRVFWPKWAKFFQCTMLTSLCIVPFCSSLWRPSQCPNLIQVCFLERSTYLLSRTSGSFEFGLHFLLQNWVLPKLLPLCPKRGREVIFGVFLTFLGAQNLSKFLGHLWGCIFFHEKYKNSKFSLKGDPHQKRAPGGTAYWGKNVYFVSKFPKFQKVSQIFWNLGRAFSIKCYVGPRKPQPRSKVYLALFASLMPSSTWPSSS